MTRGSLTLKLGQLTPEIMLNPEYDENITSNSVPFAENFRTISFSSQLCRFNILTFYYKLTLLMPYISYFKG